MMTSHLLSHSSAVQAYILFFTIILQALVGYDRLNNR